MLYDHLNKTRAGMTRLRNLTELSTAAWQKLRKP